METPSDSPLTCTMLNDLRTLHHGALQPGVLDKKSKELIALCTAVSVGSETSIAYHLHNVLEAGATSDEIVEALDVVLTTMTEPAAMRARQVLRGLEPEGRSPVGDQPHPYMRPG